LAEVKSYYLDMFQRSVHRVEGLLKENEELRSQLAAEKTRYDELEEQYEGIEEKYKELDEKYKETVEWWREEEAKVAEQDKIIAQLRSQIDEERDGTINALYTLHGLQLELSDLKQNSDSDFDSAGKAGEVVSWLRKEVGKALPKQVTVKAVQKILEG